MNKIFGLEFSELAALVTVIGGFITFVSWVMNQLIFKPVTQSVNTLSDRIEEMNISRKENEGKLFNITDDHTREITRLDGRVNTLEVMNQSTTMRLDRMEERNIK